MSVKKYFLIIILMHYCSMIKLFFNIKITYDRVDVFILNELHHNLISLPRN